MVRGQRRDILPTIAGRNGLGSGNREENDGKIYLNVYVYMVVVRVRSLAHDSLNLGLGRDRERGRMVIRNKLPLSLVSVPRAASGSLQSREPVGGADELHDEHRKVRFCRPAGSLNLQTGGKANMGNSCSR